MKIEELCHGQCLKIDGFGDLMSLNFVHWYINLVYVVEAEGKYVKYVTYDCLLFL